MDFGGRDDTTLIVDVWDRDLIGPDEYIGQVKVNLSELAVNVTDTRWWPLDQTPIASRSKVTSLFIKQRDNSQYRPEICLIITVADLYDLATPDESLAKSTGAFVDNHYRMILTF